MTITKIRTVEKMIAVLSSDGPRANSPSFTMKREDGQWSVGYQYSYHETWIDSPVRADSLSEALDALGRKRYPDGWDDPECWQGVV